jgi:hypothetical protein
MGVGWSTFGSTAVTLHRSLSRSQRRRRRRKVGIPGTTSAAYMSEAGIRQERPHNE